MEIRPATLDDAPAVAAVHVASWQATYRGVIADDVLDGPDLPVNRLRLWQRVLGEDRPPGHATLVADLPESGVAGFVDVTRSRDDDADSSTGEVLAIYALPAAWGTGVGRALMAAGLDVLREGDFRAASLWVLDGNARARRFYALAGFAADGTTKVAQLAGATITEVRYRRSLT